MCVLWAPLYNTILLIHGYHYLLQARVAGYALSGGGRGIERVDISVDGGKTWVEARRYQKDNVPYVSDGPHSDKWAWVHFEATLDIPPNAEIVAKAVSENHRDPLTVSQLLLLCVKRFVKMHLVDCRWTQLQTSNLKMWKTYGT